MKQKIYEVIDSFLTEARDQNGNDRSLERLNADRHLAAEKFLELFLSQKAEMVEKLLQELTFYRNDEGVKELEDNTDYIKVSEIRELNKKTL